MSATIIFDNRRGITLPSLLTYLRDQCGLAAEMGEWPFFGQVVPQILLTTNPPIALQLNERPDVVPEEVQELLDSYGDFLNESERTAARRCESRIEVVSGEPTRIDQFPEGGILTSTPEVDLDAPDVRLVVRRVTGFVDGWCYDNGNGRWIGVA